MTETFNSPWHFPDSKTQLESNADFVGEVFLRCNAREVIENCGRLSQELAKQAYGESCLVPEIKIDGHLSATFPYILSHLEYIIGELLRNSVQAVMERYKDSPGQAPPIEVLVCEASQHVIIRISDQGGGVSSDILPYLWSFSKGPKSETRLKNLQQVPKMAATMQELQQPGVGGPSSTGKHGSEERRAQESSLSTLTSRPPNLRLGMGLPMSRVYAEYWAGSLELHNLEGYGVDVFLQISKLGNKNEQLSTRASMDAI